MSTPPPQLYAHSWDDAFPPPRYDDVPWVEVRIEQLTTANGVDTWTQIDTQPVAAAPDPAQPGPVDITTAQATVEAGWFRFRFVDGVGTMTPYTDPVFSPYVAEPPWRPTLWEVAKVTPAYTRGGFDDDEQWAGAEQGVYTDTTNPTAATVQGHITAACDEVEGRVGVTIPEKHYKLARSTAKWHAAAAIAAGKQPASTDDASGEYRGHITNYRACLDALVVLCRMPRAPRLH